MHRNSDSVIKQAELIVNTQNDSVAAPEWSILSHLLALCEACAVVFPDNASAVFLLCFKGRRGQNLRDLLIRNFLLTY